MTLNRFYDLPTKADLNGWRLQTTQELNSWRLQSKQDLTTWKLQWAGLGAGIIGIIGGLDWLEARIERAAPRAVAPPAPSPPIVIQLPAQPQAALRR